MLKKTVIALYDGVSNVAAALGISYTAVYNWPARVPTLQQLVLERLKPGVLKWDGIIFPDKRAGRPRSRPRIGRNGNASVDAGAVARSSEAQRQVSAARRLELSIAPGWSRTDEGIMATARALGLEIQPGETFVDIKTRCIVLLSENVT